MNRMRTFAVISIPLLSFPLMVGHILSQPCKGFDRGQESTKTTITHEAACDFSAYMSLELDANALEQSARTKVDPIYPEEARRQGVQGLVMVKVLVNPLGKIDRACAVSGDELLRPAAEAAALQWEYEDVFKAVQNGKSIALDPGIPFYFVLNKQATPLDKSLKKFGAIDFAKANYGTLSEIRGKHRVFIFTENPTARDRVYLVLQQYRDLEIVDKPEEAEFYIGYARWQRRLEDLVGPLPADLSEANEPVSTQNLIVFTVSRVPKKDKMQPRILLWGNIRLGKLPSSMKFDQVPFLATLIAFNSALKQLFIEK